MQQVRAIEDGDGNVLTSYECEGEAGRILMNEEDEECHCLA